MNDAKFSFDVGAEFAADLFDKLAEPDMDFAGAIADMLCAFAIVSKEYRRDVAVGLAVGLVDALRRGTAHGQEDGKEYRDYLAENNRLQEKIHLGSEAEKERAKKERQRVVEDADFSAYLTEAMAAPAYHRAADVLIRAIRTGPFADHQQSDDIQF